MEELLAPSPSARGAQCRATLALTRTTPQGADPHLQCNGCPKWLNYCQSVYVAFYILQADN